MDISNFIRLFRKNTYMNELTPEVMRELYDKTVIRAPDKPSGHRQQRIEIYYHFSIILAVITGKDNTPKIKDKPRSNGKKSAKRKSPFAAQQSRKQALGEWWR